MCGSVRSLQRRFPIDNDLLRSGDILDQVMKLCEIARNLMFLGRQISRERASQISDRIFIHLGHRRPRGKVWWPAKGAAMRSCLIGELGNMQ